ncbi:hypothetical protein BASA50_006526 [Batrachochytrium salamandrivorans]|uniref:Uncharacterized protein n=1 Tax=Batrachochytrium salamandrivorans TaxID=1357716 RepID=A0ABQ8FAZ9_9FUNG|nr:hypothetical protein BASA50_006526 [Batrachochytrium salamandrivorans]KAJ1340602.1 hypothetical protein BSLG_004696 [Batrachochytrium salamandrivorans]
MGKPFPVEVLRPSYIGLDPVVAIPTQLPSDPYTHTWTEVSAVATAQHNARHDTMDDAWDSLHSDGHMDAIDRLLAETCTLHVSNLRMYLQLLLGRMTLSAKETVTELLWSTLQPHEQQLFALPYFSNRWSEHEVLEGLQSPWITRAQQQQQQQPSAHAATGMGESDQGTYDMAVGTRSAWPASSASSTRSFDPNRGRMTRNPTPAAFRPASEMIAAALLPPPRLYTEVPTFSPPSVPNHSTLSAGPATPTIRATPSTSSTSSTTSTISLPDLLLPTTHTHAASPDRQASTRRTTLQQPESTLSLPTQRAATRSNTMTFEDQIFAVLIEAIVRAERVERSITAISEQPHRLGRLPLQRQSLSHPGSRDSSSALQPSGIEGSGALSRQLRMTMLQSQQPQQPQLQQQVQPSTLMANTVASRIHHSRVDATPGDATAALRDLLRTTTAGDSATTTDVVSSTSGDSDPSEILIL